MKADGTMFFTSFFEFWVVAVNRMAVSSGMEVLASCRSDPMGNNRELSSYSLAEC